MSNPIKQEDFVNSLITIFEETFDVHHGVYLDKGTSLFQTLDSVTAQQASIPIGGKCASLAAQVEHVIFYLDVLERYIVRNDSSPADWGEIWRRVEKVTPEEWESSKDKLKDAYARIMKMFRSIETWNENAIGGAMGIVVHTAYHLGEIRQALCVLK
jgi:hypothetical protein